MAFIFVPMLAMFSIVAMLTATLAAHWFLHVIESTAAGGKEVVWSDEPFVDRFWKVFYVAWHGIIWAGPAMLIGRAVGGGSPTNVFLFGAVAFWAMFPLGMLSGMSSGSKWLPLVPGLPARLLQRLPATVGFYLVSLPVFGAFVLLFVFGVVRSQTPTATAIVCGTLSGVFALMYARVLGRLGLVLSFTEGGRNYEDPADRRRVRRSSGSPRLSPDQPGTMSAAVPRVTEEMPESERPTANVAYTVSGSIAGYDVIEDGFEERVVPARIVHRFDDENDTPMRLVEPISPSVVEAALRTRTGATGDNVARAEAHVAHEDEIALFDKTRRVEEPTSPYGFEMWAFLFYPSAIGVMVRLCAMLALVSMLMAGLRATNPTG